MKITILFLALLLVTVLSSSSATTVTAGPDSPQKERGVTKFDKPVMLLGIELQGEYLFVHDDAAMMRGENCTYVYKGTAEKRDKLVVSFHCTPQQRKKATHFTVRSKQTSPGIYQIEEIQFADSTESHLVQPRQFHSVGVTGL